MHDGVLDRSSSKVAPFGCQLTTMALKTLKLSLSPKKVGCTTEVVTSSGTSVQVGQSYTRLAAFVDTTPVKSAFSQIEEEELADFFSAALAVNRLGRCRATRHWYSSSRWTSLSYNIFMTIMIEAPKWARLTLCSLVTHHHLLSPDKLPGLRTQLPLSQSHLDRHKFAK